MSTSEPEGSARSPRAVHVIGKHIDAAVQGSRAAILVEGVSDRCALEALAQRRGRDLRAEGISIVPMGGATNICHFLEHLGPHGLDIRLAGVCDAAEQGYFLRGLVRAGFGSQLSRADMETLGFHVCVEDLEDELVRALGASAVEGIVAAQGEIGSFRILQKQPAQRGRGLDQQLRRFFGSQSGRKSRYARLLAESLEPTRVPAPLERVLAHV